MRDRSTRIDIEAGGDVVVSADEVGRDKIVGTGKVEKKSKPVLLGSSITKLAGNITKVVAAVKALF